MWTSTDGGATWSKPQTLFAITDVCEFVDPLSQRCIMDGQTGARMDLGAIPSVDIANGAPTGAGATNLIVDAWSDALAGVTMSGRWSAHRPTEVVTGPRRAPSLR